MTPVSISFKIEKADKTGRYVAGWLSVVEKDGKVVEDTQGDRISMSELRKGVHRYMNGERTIKKQHAGGEIGKMVEVVMIDDDFAKAHGITHTKRGAWGTAEITDEATRDDVRKGKVTGWSMGGKGKRTPISKAVTFRGQRMSRAERRNAASKSGERQHAFEQMKAMYSLGAKHSGGPMAWNSRARVLNQKISRRASVRKSRGFFDRFL